MSVKKSLYEYWKELSELNPEKRILGNEREWFTAGQLLSLSEHMASAFYTMGIKAGDHVVLKAKRDPAIFIALIALRIIGSVCVLTDPRNDEKDILSEIHPQIPVAFTIEETGEKEFTIRDQKGDRTVINMLKLAPSHITPANEDGTEPAFIIFTSGSTGIKKAVVLSEGNLIANLTDSAPLGHYSTNDIALFALPMDHVFGLALFTGVAVLRYAAYFPEATDITSLLIAIEEGHVTRMNGVPSLYLAMCEKAAEYDLSSLCAGFIGGAPTSTEQFCYIENTLGMTLIPVYGMSECIGIACADWKAPRDLRKDNVGRFYPLNEGKILAEDGSEAPAGTEGEIAVRGPMRMLGLYGHMLPPEEWLLTGDLGFLDEKGFLHISGRKKEIIIRNGVNLSPVRIENVINGLDHVKAASVVSIPDAFQGEVPAAMIVTDADENAILEALSEILQKNELPARIMTVKELPLTSSGKPDKIRIRKAFTGE